MKIKYIFLALLSSLLCGCNEEGDTELYEKLIYMTRNGLQRMDFFIGQTPSDTLISVYCGGSQYPSQNVTVLIGKDAEALNVYNSNHFESEADYYEILPDSCFEVLSYETTIQKNTTFGKIPLEFYTYKIDPLHKYILPLSIQEVSDYRVNENLKSVLIQVGLLNRYSGTYRFMGYAVEEGKTSKARINREQLLPVAGENSVYLNAESKTFEKDGNNFRIKMIINPDNSITMTSDNQEVLQVENCLPFAGVDSTPMDNRYDPQTNTMRIVYKYMDAGKTNKKRIVVCDLIPVV